MKDNTTTNDYRLHLWSTEYSEMPEIIKRCEQKGHSQQVVYSTNLDGMTQICFTCKTVNTSISIEKVWD